MDGEDWDVLWTHRPQLQSLAPMQLQRRPAAGHRLANHCGGYFAGAGDKCAFGELTRKLMSTAAARLPGEGQRHLRVFVLDKPEQNREWTAVVLQEPDRHWVLKPCSGGASQGIVIGRGESLLRDQSARSGRYVAQEYLERPFQGLGGKKFHLRLYVLVTRWSPPGAYLFHEGLIFRSELKHQEGGSRSEKRDAFSGISDTVEAEPLAVLWQAIAGRADQLPDHKQVWARIAALLGEILDAPQRQGLGRLKDLEEQQGLACFDLFGVDVLLDEALQPWVMEFNVGANMEVDNHGPKHQERLLQAKRPLMQQVLRWAALRSGLPPASQAAAEAQERAALLNFTRLL